MEGIFQWVKEIFLVIISFTFFQILVPDSELSKYVKFIFSLILLVIVLDPIIHAIQKQ